MGIIKQLKFVLGFGGKNFTYKEKWRMLDALDGYGTHVRNCASLGWECEDLGKWLFQRLEANTYSKLVDTYHNHGFYSKRIERTRPYAMLMWDATDYHSRIEAVDMLKEAIIND